MTRWLPVLRPLLLLLAFLTAALPARAMDPATTGVVVLHGKWGQPGNVAPLAGSLETAGFLVESPTMAWSGGRMFDLSFDRALDEVTAAAQRLRQRGATRIVVAGHSLGGNAALRYAALGLPADALVLVAPAHLPEGTFIAEACADSLEKARAMVAAGQGDERAWFQSVNSGNRKKMVETTALAYLSYYAADGAAAMSRTAPQVPRLPILWIAPTQDPSTRQFAERVVPALRAPLVRVEVNADHMGAPGAAGEAVVDWLRTLP